MMERTGKKFWMMFKISILIRLKKIVFLPFLQNQHITFLMIKVKVGTHSKWRLILISIMKWMLIAKTLMKYYWHLLNVIKKETVRMTSFTPLMVLRVIQRFWYQMFHTVPLQNLMVFLMQVMIAEFCVWKVKEILTDI